MIKNSSFFLLLVSGGVLFGTPPRSESLAVQEMRTALDQVGYQLHGHQVEIDLFQERLDKIEKAVDAVSKQLRQGTQDRSFENRLAKLEKAHETLVADLKNLKGHLNDANSSLASCQSKLSQIDKQLSSDVKGLKHSLETMLVLLQKGETASNGPAYIVKSGDSLGQIAIDHKTDVKTLKQLNNLDNDTIYIGQKLFLPQ